MAFTTQLHPLKDGRLLAEGILADVPSLNALSHGMVAAMRAALAGWRSDEQVAAVVLRGDGDRHFCAGGNIRDAAQNIRAHHWDKISAFFCDEYRLDAALHNYPKPVIGWATGAVMGGGMGVFQGCGLRLVTDTVKMAMPEVYIGLFPDVGAGWFLRRCPPPLGLFLGLSGATLAAPDALYANLADFAMPAGGREAFMARLQALDWQQTAADNLALVRQTAAEMTLANGAAGSTLAAAMPEISACCQQGDAAAVVAALAQAQHPWLQAQMAQLENASAGSIAYWHRHWHSLDKATLAEVLAADYRAVMAFCRDPGGEFMEGVRALVIDKDKNPQWQYARCAEVPAEWPPLHAEDIAIAEKLKAKLAPPA